MRFIIGTFFFCLSLGSGVAANLEQGESAVTQGNYLKARAIFSELAQQGDIEAQVRLGELYDKGKGGPRDFKRAIKLFRKAALTGYAKAQYYMGVKYFNGHGVPKDEKLAYAWFAVALDNGYTKAAQPLKVLNRILSPEDRQKALKLGSGQLSGITHVITKKK